MSAVRDGVEICDFPPRHPLDTLPPFSRVPLPPDAPLHHPCLERLSKAHTDLPHEIGVPVPAVRRWKGKETVQGFGDDEEESGSGERGGEGRLCQGRDGGQCREQYSCASHLFLRTENGTDADLQSGLNMLRYPGSQKQVRSHLHPTHRQTNSLLCPKAGR